jgi:protein disulfide-isomerase A1
MRYWWIHLKFLAQVAVFPEFAGAKYENFMAVAEKMRANYDFFHTSDTSILPRGDQAVKGPFVRLFKPFDELFADSQVHICSRDKLNSDWFMPI